MRALALSTTQSRIYRANCNDLTRHGPSKAPVRRGFFVSRCQSVKAAMDFSGVNWVSGTTKACHTLGAPQRAAFPQYSIDRAPMQRSARANDPELIKSLCLAPTQSRITAGRDGAAGIGAILSICGRGGAVLRVSRGRRDVSGTPCGGTRCIDGHAAGSARACRGGVRGRIGNGLFLAG